MDETGPLPVSDDAARAPIGLARLLALGMVPVIALVNFWLGGPLLAMVFLSVGMAMSAVLALTFKGPFGGILMGVALVGQAVIFTASFAGHPWQIDSHMLFFVMLAVTAILRSIPALLVAAAVIAVHHLSLGLLIPALVFPSTDLLINFERVLMHAVIVVLEVVFLSLAIVAHTKDDAAKRSAQNAQQASEEAAEILAREANELRAKAEADSAAALRMTQALGQTFKAIAAKDLTGRLGNDYGPEYQPMVHDYNQAVDAVVATLSQALEMIGDVEVEAAASSEMTSTMATQLETQSVQVSDTATALRGLTASLQETVEDITNVRASAASATAKASEGGTIVREAVSAMNEIKSSSSEIEKIISLIEDISFQTKLLALNAGVEAARAGVAGAGFAVVASEVRALAHRTSDAANQVSDLISSSTQHVAHGAEMVDKAGLALIEIEASVADAGQRIDDLSKRATEQSGAVNDVSHNLEGIDSAVQSYAAKTEELSAMGTRIASGAEGLNGRLGQFVIGDGPRATPQRARVA